MTVRRFFHRAAASARGLWVTVYGTATLEFGDLDDLLRTATWLGDFWDGVLRTAATASWFENFG